MKKRGISIILMIFYGWDQETLDLYTRRNIQVQIESNRVRYGYNKGLAKGELKNQRATARKMLADGMALERVAKYTELSLKEVKALLEKI